MTERDCRMLMWFLDQGDPVTAEDVARRWGLATRTARRRLAVWYRADLAQPAGFAGPSGRSFSYRPIDRRAGGRP